MGQRNSAWPLTLRKVRIPSGVSDVSRPLLRTEQPPNKQVPCVGAVEQSDGVKRLVRNVANGIRAQQEPETSREGMGGAYFFKNDGGRMAAIFKPCDEEPFAPNNPKGWNTRNMGAPGMKPGIRVGEAALREVAAFLLDHEGFAGVPAAVLAKVSHPALNYKVLLNFRVDFTQYVCYCIVAVIWRCYVDDSSPESHQDFPCRARFG